MQVQAFSEKIYTGWWSPYAFWELPKPVPQVTNPWYLRSRMVVKDLSRPSFLGFDCQVFPKIPAAIWQRENSTSEPAPPEISYPLFFPLTDSWEKKHTQRSQRFQFTPIPPYLSLTDSLCPLKEKNTSLTPSARGQTANIRRFGYLPLLPTTWCRRGWGLGSARHQGASTWQAAG